MYQNDFSHHKYLKAAYSMQDQGMTPLEIVNHFAVDDPFMRRGKDMRDALYHTLHSRSRYAPVYQRAPRSSMVWLVPATRELLKARFSVAAVAHWYVSLKLLTFRQAYGFTYRLWRREFQSIPPRKHHIRRQDLPAGWTTPRRPPDVPEPAQVPDVDFSCD